MSIIDPTKRERKNLTKAVCEARVTRQTKTHDAKVGGLYVSVSPKSGAVFNLKYTNPATRERSSVGIGVYHRELFTIEQARIKAMALKARIGNGEDIAATARRTRDQQAKQALTVSELIDLRIECISALEPKGRAKDGVTLKMGPVKKDWANMASHLNRFVRPRLGSKIASEVTKGDIVQLQKDILAGTLIIKPGKTTKKGSISSARHMRKAVSGLFSWAAEFDYVSTSPCVKLPKLSKEPPRERKLSHDEIRTLWRGLDRPDMPIDRRICLALKFALVTMLRSTELLHIHRDELGPHGLRAALVVIPEERVKACREIHQPLSDLAVEIAKEAMGNYPWMFAGRFGTEPLNRKAMACALRGKTKRLKGKLVIESEGICRMLGIRPFTPHDLRRTAASLMGSIRVPGSIVSRCLDHTVKKDEHGEIAAITGKHYDQDHRIEEKREALQKLADEIRRIVSAPMEAQQEMRQAA